MKRDTEGTSPLERDQARSSQKEDLMKFRSISRYSFLVLLFISFAAGAQMAGSDYATRMSENSEQLRQYVHLRKTEIYWRGKLRSTQLAQIHYDTTSGKEIVEPLGSTSDNASSHGGPISTMIAKEISGDVKENIRQTGWSYGRVFAAGS